MGWRTKTNYYYSTDSAPSCQMTVIHLFDASPRIESQVISSFGVVPFPASSSVPVTSEPVLMKNATSILLYCVIN